MHTWRNKSQAKPKKKRTQIQHKKLSTKKRKGRGQGPCWCHTAASRESVADPDPQNKSSQQEPKISNGKRKPTAIIVIITRQRQRQQATGKAAGGRQQAAGIMRLPQTGADRHQGLPPKCSLCGCCHCQRVATGYVWQQRLVLPRCWSQRGCCFVVPLTVVATEWLNIN